MLTLHVLTFIDILQHRFPKSQVFHLYTVYFYYNSITNIHCNTIHDLVHGTSHSYNYT